MLARVRDPARLTSFSHGAGCGCKLGPDDLAETLAGLSIPATPTEVLVAADTGDDAAVWRVSDTRALVATLDFFTPIVDDPYDWGRIAATNAMSDVYAMGGAPFLALNIVSWPVDDLPLEMMGRVLQGGIDAAAKAGVAVLGGHTITDPEPKYGMVVLGEVDPQRIVRNSTAREGDELFLTKPLGLGLISTAVKQGTATPELLATAVDLMTTTNAAAATAIGPRRRLGSHRRHRLRPHGSPAQDAAVLRVGRPAGRAGSATHSRSFGSGEERSCAGRNPP